MDEINPVTIIFLGRRFDFEIPTGVDFEEVIDGDLLTCALVTGKGTAEEVVYSPVESEL